METSEARRWFDSYFTDFVALGRGDITDIRTILAWYGVPMLVSTDAGTMHLSDEAQVLAMAQQQVDGMRSAGYHRSEQFDAETAVLNQACATHHARFSRLRADGTEITQLEATYLITDAPDGRRISAIVVHSQR